MNLIQITIISTKGKNHLEDMVKPLQSTKESKIHYWVEQSQEQQNYLGSFPRPIIHITVIQVYAPITDAKEAEVDPFYEDLQHLLELTPKKDVLFITGDQNAKVGSQACSAELQSCSTLC